MILINFVIYYVKLLFSSSFTLNVLQSVKFILYIVVIFSITNIHGQYNSGIVKYGIKYYDENKTYSKKKYATNVRKFLEKRKEIQRKYFAQDAVFIKLKFNEYSYYSEPIEIIIPESISKKYSRLIYRNPIVYGDLVEKSFLFHVNNSLGNMIVNNTKNYEWKITDEYKMIAGYKCRKAYKITESNPDNLNYMVWFTPQIPVAFTPVRYHGLPGATLGIKSGPKYIYAKEVKFIDDVTIKKPSDDKQISFKEYRKIITRFKPD